MATEKRLIDAKPLMQNGWHLVQTGESNRFIQSMSLADVPTVDTVEVVHGRWIEKQEAIPWCEDDVEVYTVCSVCESYSPAESNYCPNCGAKMDGDGNGRA